MAGVSVAPVCLTQARKSPISNTVLSFPRKSNNGPGPHSTVWRGRVAGDDVCSDQGGNDDGQCERSALILRTRRHPGGEREIRRSVWGNPR
jgi:hypothetical protein